MRYFFVILLVFMLTSCEYFKVKKTSSEAILKEELETFNWNDVDVYPTFAECDSVALKEEKKQCFEYAIIEHISYYLHEEMIVVTKDINDTIMLQFQVSKSGDLTLVNAQIDTLTSQEIPEISNLLNKSLDALPKIFPAIKRGQHVTTEFNLPVIINVN